MIIRQDETERPGAAEGTEEEISEEEIKAVIGNYKEMLEDLGRSLEVLRWEYRLLGEDIREYALLCRSGVVREIRSEAAALDIKDPEQTKLGRKEQELRECRRELARSMEELEQKRLRIRRIHMAYRLLPREEFTVLKGLYQEKRCWKTFPRELGIAKRKVSRLRNQGMLHIRERVKRQLVR